MQKETMSSALKYVEFNATKLVANIHDESCANSTKEEYAKALDLLVSLFNMKLQNVKSIYDDSQKESRDLRYRVIANQQIELIQLITKL